MIIKAKYENNAILKCFKKFYPSLNPKAIYKIENGFLIFAPILEDETDYGDPYYFVDSKLTSASPLNMKYFKQMGKAFDDGPIWKK